jgi:bifunctional non-homologous end joining protein LigD
MSKVRRQGRIFIDLLRNERAATAVDPFSVRARMAVPVTWDEFKMIKSPNAFELKSAFE